MLNYSLRILLVGVNLVTLCLNVITMIQGIEKSSSGIIIWDIVNWICTIILVFFISVIFKTSIANIIFNIMFFLISLFIFLTYSGVFVAPFGTSYRFLLHAPFYILPFQFLLFKGLYRSIKISQIIIVLAIVIFVYVFGFFFMKIINEKWDELHIIHQMGKIKLYCFFVVKIDISSGFAKDAFNTAGIIILLNIFLVINSIFSLIIYGRHKQIKEMKS